MVPEKVHFLKILSKVTSPTKGNIKVKGRIASLLEVGTGFHPELTGRENIFLNGAILGMTKAEIRSKFDEIVAFSGVEKYIDTPVKRYSSGMYVRLAFAVAAHLEPEILIVDEVLAVGDAEFQNKCLGKMKDVSGEGRTVLFVSHNMAAVKSLCSKGLLVSKGKIELHSDILSVVKKYEDLEELEYCYEYYGNKQIKSIVIKSSENKIYFNSSIEFQLTFKVLTPIRNAICGFVIKDNHHMNIVTVNNKHYNQELLHESLVSNGTFTIKIKKLNLIPGSYTIDFFLGDGIKDICKIENRIKIEVLSLINETIINKLNKSENKLFIPEITWKLENTF